jgi:mercuric ion transport protein
MLLDRLQGGRKTSQATLAGGVLAALLSSLCCLGPLVLVTLGIGGAWMANLAALEPYRPLFLGVAVVCVVLAYRYIYHTPAPAECEPGTLCALPHTQRVYKRMF